MDQHDYSPIDTRSLLFPHPLLLAAFVQRGVIKTEGSRLNWQERFPCPVRNEPVRKLLIPAIS